MLPKKGVKTFILECRADEDCPSDFICGYGVCLQGKVTQNKDDFYNSMKNNLNVYVNTF